MDSGYAAEKRQYWLCRSSVVIRRSFVVYICRTLAGHPVNVMSRVAPAIRCAMTRGPDARHRPPEWKIYICPYSGRARAGWFKVETEYCQTWHPCKSDGTRPIEDPALEGTRFSWGGETGARMLLQIYASLAQLAEQRTVNPRVVGSIPARSARRSVQFRLVGRGLVRRDAGSTPADMFRWSW